MRNKFAEWKKADYVLAIIFIAQIVFLIVMNFTHIRDMVDYDSSCAFAHAREVWNQKKLLIDNWGYQTTIDLDSIVWLVALIYGVTKDILFSQAMGNSVIIIVYIYTICRLMQNLKISITARLIGLMFYFIPYSLGQLGYLPMLFSGGAFYTVRALIPLILLSILSDIQNGRNVRNYIGRAVYLMIMLYFAGLSSGVYILLCGIMPFIAFEIIQAVWGDDIRIVCNKRMLFLTLAAGSAVLGVASEKIFGLSTKATDMVLVDKTSWIDNIFSYFVGIFELFGGVAAVEGVKLLSIDGIFVLCNWALITCIFIAIGYFAVKGLRERKIQIMHGYMLTLFAVNFLVLTLLYTTYGGGTFEYRYHLMPMLPFFVMATQMLDELIAGKNRLLKQSLTGLLYLLLILSMLLGDRELIHIDENSNSDELQAMNDYLESQDISLALMLGNDSDGRKIRVFGDSVDYIAWDLKEEEADSWGASRSKFDNGAQIGKMAIVAMPEVFATLPVYLKEGAQYLQTMNGKDIYVMKESKFDFVSGLPDKGESAVDFPWSEGYSYMNATINDGALVSDGTPGTVLVGPYCDGKSGVYRYEIHYRIVESASEEDTAVFSVTKDYGTVELGTAVLNKDSDTAVVEAEISENDREIEHKVSVPEGMVIEIYSIEIQ